MKAFKNILQQIVDFVREQRATKCDQNIMNQGVETEARLLPPSIHEPSTVSASVDPGCPVFIWLEGLIGGQKVLLQFRLAWSVNLLSEQYAGGQENSGWWE